MRRGRAAARGTTCRAPVPPWAVAVALGAAPAAGPLWHAAPEPVTALLLLVSKSEACLRGSLFFVEDHAEASRSPRVTGSHQRIPLGPLNVCVDRTRCPFVAKSPCSAPGQPSSGPSARRCVRAPRSGGSALQSAKCCILSFSHTCFLLAVSPSRPHAGAVCPGSSGEGSTELPPALGPRRTGLCCVSSPLWLPPGSSGEIYLLQQQTLGARVPFCVGTGACGWKVPIQTHSTVRPT